MLTVNERTARLLAKHRVERFDGPHKTPFKIGDKLINRDTVEFEAYSRHPSGLLMSMGAFSYVAAAQRDMLHSKIGRYCSIARGSHIVEGIHPIDSVTTSPWHYSEYFDKHMEEYQHVGPKKVFRRSYGSITIGHDVWLGGYCTFKGGIKIGTGAVVAAGSVVVKDIPPYAIFGGNPAKLIRTRFAEETIQRLLATQWWNVSPHHLKTLDFFDIDGFCQSIEDQKASDKLTSFEPAVFRVESGEVVLESNAETDN